MLSEALLDFCRVVIALQREGGPVTVVVPPDLIREMRAMVRENEASSEPLTPEQQIAMDRLPKRSGVY